MVLGELKHSSGGPTMFAAKPKQLPSEPGDPRGQAAVGLLTSMPQAHLSHCRLACRRKHQAPRRNLQSSALSPGWPTLDLYQLFKQTLI